MSRENMEIVRSICASWERGDFGSADWAHTDIAYVIADGPTPGSWTGRAGLVEGWRNWLNAFEDFRAEAVEYRELDEERVLVLTDFTGRGRTSGVDIGQTQSRGANIFHMRDGRVTRLVTYLNRAEALTAVGLRE